jgi:hypothetical protein
MHHRIALPTYSSSNATTVFTQPTHTNDNTVNPDLKPKFFLQLISICHPWLEAQLFFPATDQHLLCMLEANFFFSAT